MEGSVYILQSQKTGHYYIGSAQDVNIRLAQHNGGRVTSTRNKGPWLLIFQQLYPEIKSARQVEYKIKRIKRREFIEKIILAGKIIGL